MLLSVGLIPNSVEEKSVKNSGENPEKTQNINIFQEKNGAKIWEKNRKKGEKSEFKEKICFMFQQQKTKNQDKMPEIT